ncbi:SSU ribosomal protein S1p [Acidisarcina polymorpha]|uniref:SSU ribosomal protein S1p n=1 Tax=Acidisarcina polymorpha TaxID=2211140 RepID=A0A2Z5G1A1_9BACT|nr:S1 RNA-binding domain-containing protein [Acidisarcina polymorpha]AXC12858.1 SSU ribosomal protein S1p [Acidisarcina polymorpha]
MPDSNVPELSAPDLAAVEPVESFSDILSQFEKNQVRKSDDGSRQIDATLVALTAESALFDIGFKTEGILPLAAFAGKEIKVGDHFQVSVKGRDAEGYYELSLLKVVQPKDWSLLEQAFNDKEAVLGTITAVVKGGLTVDIGTRAFMPASRSGARDAAEMAKLIGQQVRVRIIKLEVAEEDVVVDRRVLAEEEERVTKERRYSEVREGDVVQGVVRSLADYGAFVDLGGVDGLLHVSDIAWSRVANPADVLAVGQTVEVKVLKIDPEKKRISLGLKQLQPQPWDSVPDKYKTGERVRGPVTRLTEFGAFVELEPGVEGLIHLSEMSWAKKVHKPGDIFKQGEIVEAVILGIKLEERRISLGFKQLLTDPWAEAAQRLGPGSVVEGPVTSFTKFGAFIQVAEGLEGMVHISEITAEMRLHHPQEALKVGEVVKAQVLELDKEKRQLKLSIKQLTPISVDEYFAEHKSGDIVTGRVIEIADGLARVELGEGIYGESTVPQTSQSALSVTAGAKADLSSLTSMLQARWKGSSPAATPVPKLAEGHIRSFRIKTLDASTRIIQLTLN